MEKSDALFAKCSASLWAGVIALILCGCSVQPPSREPAVKVLVVASSDRDHEAMIAKAQPFLEALAAENHFALDFTRDAGQINEANLAQYQVFVQLHLAPFNMSASQQKALQKFIEEGHGWIGIHAAGLTGKQFLAPGTPYWQWFQDLMGGHRLFAPSRDSDGFGRAGESSPSGDAEPARVVGDSGRVV